MDNSRLQPNPRHKVNPADKLKNRLFEKGLGHSSMSSFKSPLSTDYTNRMLLVNLTSANSSKYSPKVIRKQVAGIPFQKDQGKDKKKASSNQSNSRLKTASYDKFYTKQMQFLQQIALQEKKKSKLQTTSNFYNKNKKDIDEIQEINPLFEEAHQSQQMRRTKNLLQKLSGKSKFVIRNEKKSCGQLISFKQQKNEKTELNSHELFLKNRSYSKFKQPAKITLQNYISRALKDQENLQQFLYLANTKQNISGNERIQEDPYELYVIQYDSNKENQLTLNNKYYTVSKKGLCYYVNSKPVQFIELDQWVNEKQNYQKIKNLNFFNRFRKWKTVKMWRKIVLRHRIQKCSKNLEQKLFLLNPIMRSCLFQIQEITVDLQKNLVILGGNNDDYSLENFKAIQEKNKKRISTVIEELSKKSRNSVKRCFEENLKNLKGDMREKQKQEQQQKNPNITTHINLKDSAFQALGFPPKMSYENRSKLRKMASKFIRFSYLIDMIHSAGLALCFKNQISSFISKLEESQQLSNLQVIMTKEDSKTLNNSGAQNNKIFNIKLKLVQKQPSPQTIVLLPFKTNQTDGLQMFNPIYHIRLSGQDLQNQSTALRKYCPTICSQWLSMEPKFQDIYEQIISQIKQSLNCLKFFQRWSKHRDMQKFINILEEWDDVVSQSRQICQNQNLDPVGTITNIQTSITEIKKILFHSLKIINTKIQEQFTEFLNIHWQQQQIDLSVFKNPKLQSPAETVKCFLKYIINSINDFDKKIPQRIRLGIFEINLCQIKVQLMRQAEDTYNNFKQMLPQVVQQRTQFLDNWFEKYIKFLQNPVQNIDQFIGKVKLIKEIQKTFQSKKQLCFNLTSINQIMQIHKFGQKKKKEFDNKSNPLKAKVFLQTQIYQFQQNLQKQSQFYLNCVNKIELPNIIKDISKINASLKNEKYVTLNKNSKNYGEIIKQIQELNRKYKDIQQRNQKFMQYQSILHQCRGINKQALVVIKSGKMGSDTQQIPPHCQELMILKQSLECLLQMWQKYQKWSMLLDRYNKLTVKSILQQQQKLYQVLKQQKYFINSKLKKTLQSNQVVIQLQRIIQVFEKYFPIINGLNNNLSQTHWQQINELVQKNRSNSVVIDLQKLDNLPFSDLVASCIGQFKDQFEQIFVKASNQINLQNQYYEIEKKWKTALIKTRMQGAKYNVILDQAEHQSVIALINEAMDTLTRIFSNPYSVRLQIGVLTYESILGAMQTYNKWIAVQKKLTMYDRISKSIDMKKISQGNLIQSAQKQYKPIFKMHLVRNLQTSFNITKFCPPGNTNIRQKLQQCQRFLNSLQNNIKNMLNDQRKNYPLFYQLNDIQLLRILMQTSGQQNTNNMASIIDELICQKFMQGVVKNLMFQSQRIIGIYTIDNENVLKSSTSISLTSDIQTILDQVIEAVGDYCKRMIKSCRTKSSQNSLLSIVDDYNIQFLLAISKVDFSNYTTISIQNSQLNPESLKQYLKIMIKDTKQGMKKLKQKKVDNIYAYQTLILQNLIHQKVLEELVQSNTICANDYSWIKFIRFYWQDNSGEEIPINIRKMFVSLRYGKQFIGSNSRVLIQNNSPSNGQYDNLDTIMSIIRNSQSAFYMGNYERLVNFMNCIAHHLQKIKCTKQMTSSFGNPLKMLLKSRQGSDCCYFIEDSHLLSQQAVYQVLYSHTQYLSKNKLSIQKVQTQRKICNQLNTSSLDSVPGYYNPVFLHIQRNQNTLFMINRQQFRNVSLAVPNNQFLACYLYLIQQNITLYFTTKNDSLNNNLDQLSSTIKSLKHSRSEIALIQSTGASFVSPSQTIMVLKKLFHFIEQCQVTQKNPKLNIQIFLQHTRNKIQKLLSKQYVAASNVDRKIYKQFQLLENQPMDYFDLNTRLNLNHIILEILLDYLRPLVRQDSFKSVFQYLKIAYPEVQWTHHQQSLENSHKKVQIKIMLGYKDCLQNFQKNQKNCQNIQEINLDSYSQQELYGKQNEKGLFFKLIYNSSEIFSKNDKNCPKKVIKIRGMNERLINYLYSLVQQNTKQSTSLDQCLQRLNLSGISSLVHENPHRIHSIQRTNSLIEQAKNFINIHNLSSESERDKRRDIIVDAVMSKYSPNLGCSRILGKNNIQLTQDLLIQVHASTLSQLIDPKILTLFKIQSVIQSRFGNYWKYIDERIKNWVKDSLQPYQNQKQHSNFCLLFQNCVQKFYCSVIKGLWKDVYKVSELNLSVQNTQSQRKQSTLTQQMIKTFEEFLNLLQTLIPQIFESISNESHIPIERNIQFQKTTIYACIYSLCYVYRPLIDVNTDYIKLQNLLQKLLTESWIGILEKQRIYPDQYKLSKEVRLKMKNKQQKRRCTYYDFIFDGKQLVNLKQFCFKKHQDRILERGQYYLTDQMIHLNLVAERTLKSGKFGLIVQGEKNSGKSTFSRVYRCLHFDETIHMTINLGNKNKKEIYQKVSKVLSLKNISTICPKINFSQSLIVIDDLHLPINENKQKIKNIREISGWLSTIIKNKMIITPDNYRKYKLQNTNFIINLDNEKEKDKENKLLENLLSCSIKYSLDSPIQSQQNGLKSIFTQILKANVLDPQIQESILTNLIDFTFDFYEQIGKKISQIKLLNKCPVSLNVLNLQTIKRMTMFASHLRFKQNNPSSNEVSRFWAYLLKDNFQAYCSKFQLDIKSLQTLTKYSQNMIIQSNSQNISKSFIDYLKQPLPLILYSHLFIKQQVYGNGKQVEHVRDIQKLYSKMDECIEDYNKTDKVRRYGYSFQFISLDQLIVKIVKMSNILISGDYAIFCRRGSQISKLIRLVSYIQGFNYKQKNALVKEKQRNIKQGKKPHKIIDIVKDTILQLTKVSLYLISIKVDDSNIKQFLQYYDADFQSEVVGSLQTGYLQNIQATGAFYFGINSIQSNSNIENIKAVQSPLTIKSGLKGSGPLSYPLNFKHSHQNSNQTAMENTNRNSIHSATHQSIRVTKSSLRELNKIKRSIRLVFQFNSLKYLQFQEGHPLYMPPSTLSQLHVDFFQQYPQESIVRFSQQILMLGIPNQDQESKEIKALLQNSKDKIRLMTQIYELSRVQLQLTLKQYEECIRMYWSFLGTFPQQIKEKMNMYESIIDMDNKLKEIIKQNSHKTQLNWEQKKILTEKITKLKNSHEQDKDSTKVCSNQIQEIQQLQLKLTFVSSTLQELTQKVSQCEKILTFLQPSMAQYIRRYQMTKKLLDNQSSFLNLCLVIIASYFTYLSKLPFSSRKNYLKKWYKQCTSLCQLSEDNHITSISELFYLIRQQNMVINEQNEQYYENMTIILQSINPVLIRDDRHLGRNWMKYFDDSFVTVTESSPDFYQKLGQYLGNSNNILLQITNQETLDNSQSNFINSLLYMPQNTPKIQINDQQYLVSKQSRVYVVVAPHLVISQQIMCEHLYVTYEKSQQSFIKGIQNEIILTNTPEKYNQELEYKKKELFIMNQCLKLQFSLADTIWHQFYSNPDEQNDQGEQSQSKQNIQSVKVDNEKSQNIKKSKQELLASIQILTKKGIVDKLQQFYQKYNIRVKQLSQVRDRIQLSNLPSNYTHTKKKAISNGFQQNKITKQVIPQAKTSLEQVSSVIKKIYLLICRVESKFNLKSLQISSCVYYQTIKLAIKHNLIIINLQQNCNMNVINGYNLGMLALFILRQWGQRLTRQVYNMLALGIVVIIQSQIYQQVRLKNKISSFKSNSSIKGSSKDFSQLSTNQYDQILRKFVSMINFNTKQFQNWPSIYFQTGQSRKTQILPILAQQFKNKSFSMQILQQVITQSILSFIDHESYSQYVICHNNIAKITTNSVTNPQTAYSTAVLPKSNKIDSHAIRLGDVIINDGERRKDQNNWILNYFIIMTGNLEKNLYNEQLASETGIYDSQSFYNWYYRRAIQKILDSQMTNAIQIKNAQNIENQIKKILNDKSNIFIPLISSPYQSEICKKKNQTALQLIINQLVTKYCPHQNQQIKQDLKTSKVDFINASQIISHNNTSNRLEINKTNLFLNQTHNSISIVPKEPKIYQQFRIYIYHHDIPRLIQIIESVLGINAEKIIERVLVRDISNHMIVNTNVFNILKTKQQRKINLQSELLTNTQRNPTGQGLSNNLRQKTKKNITINLQEKSKIDKKMSHPAPSMRVLQVQGQQAQGISIIQPSQIEIPNHEGNMMTKTNKFISQNGYQYSNISLANHLYQVINNILLSVEELICRRTGKVNFNIKTVNRKGMEQNLKWFISTSYFYGIEKCTPILTIQNQSWTFYHHIITICKIFKNLMRNNRPLQIDCVSFLLNKIVSRMEAQILSLKNNIPTNLNICVSSQSKVKITSNRCLMDEKAYQLNEHQIKNAIQLLNKILQQNLSSSQLKDIRKKGKQYAQQMYFKLSWLDQLRIMIDLEPIPIKKYDNIFDNLFDNTLKVCKSTGQQRRVSRKSKILPNSTQKGKITKKNLHESMKQKQKDKQSQHEYEFLSSQENKQLNSLALHFLQKSSKKVQMKINLIKNYYFDLKDKQSNHNIQIKKVKSFNYMENLLYKLNLIHESKIMPCNWITYLKQSSQQTNFLAIIKSLQTAKNQMQAQMLKLIRDQNHPIDLTNLSNPIQFIRTYLANEFEQRITRQIFSSKQPSLAGGNQNEQLCRQQHQNCKKQQPVYYSILSTLTADQAKKQRYVRIKNIYAVGWKLNNEGTYQFTQEDKITQLNNIYICKKAKPQQMGICEIILAQSEEQKNKGIKVYVYNKKNQTQKNTVKYTYIRLNNSNQ